MKMKKFINAPETITDEELVGLGLAYPDIVEVDGHLVISKDLAHADRVTIVTYGGSGHEPAHGGYVGTGMLDAAVAGAVFTSPTPDPIYEGIKAIATDKGVLMVIKNYTGDVMNFEMAGEMAQMDDIKVAQVVVNDDVAVDGSLYTVGRRGVAGTVFVHKIAGAKAEQGAELEEVQRVAQKVIDNVRTMGVAIRPCTVPAAGKPGFELGEDEMEVGIGIHGEPGTHKEKLRERARQVDTLTLSATPIPRTLNMAMSGIRDMSTIEQPPQDRQPVQTYVLEHDWGILTDAIRRELSRGGQVYYLHNRVDSIDATAVRLREMLGGDVVVETAHGKMAEGELSRVMSRMAEGDIDVLVCTTIIETGIDIPNVNTLIIEDADSMGLSQLHQIRGRIGRSTRRAYAYLTYRTGKVLTEVAAKRLTAIREFVEFGSGFKIAMRDLEIRGAGNLLGSEQSGYMMSVGYDMYLKLLNDAVLEQQGKTVPPRVECSADITVAAFIPESYVPAPEQRMDLYRRIAALRTPEDRDELTDELLDRYGDLPPAVESLLSVALLRAAAMARGITDITQKGRQLIFTFDERVDASALLAVCTMASYRSRTQLSAGAAPRLTLYLQPKEEPLTAAGGLVDALGLHENETQQTEGAHPPKEETEHEK